MKALVLEKNVFKIKEFEKENSLNFLQKEVNGNIERISFIKVLEEKGIDVWVNEEGKLLGLSPSITIYHQNELIDVLMGNVVFTRYNDEGETIGLTDDDISFIQALLLFRTYWLDWEE